MLQLSFVSGAVGQVLLALGTVGLGMALFSAPNISAIMGSVDRSQLSLASGFQSTMRFTGQGISMAVLGAIAAWKLGAEGGRIIFLGEAGSVTSAAAFADGYQAAMLVGAILAAVGAAIAWTARPERPPRALRGRRGPAAASCGRGLERALRPSGDDGQRHVRRVLPVAVDLVQGGRGSCRRAT